MKYICIIDVSPNAMRQIISVSNNRPWHILIDKPPSKTILIGKAKNPVSIKALKHDNNGLIEVLNCFFLSQAQNEIARE